MKASPWKVLMIAIGLLSLCCTCEGPGTLKDALKAADIAFNGTVLSVRKVSFLQTIDSGAISKMSSSTLTYPDSALLNYPMIYEVKFKVLRSYKRLNKGSTVVIYTPVSEAGCGYSGFIKNNNFIVFAYSYNHLWDIISPYENFKNKGARNTFWTYVCDMTEKYNTYDDATLRKLQE